MKLQKMEDIKNNPISQIFFCLSVQAFACWGRSKKPKQQQLLTHKKDILKNNNEF